MVIIDRSIMVIINLKFRFYYKERAGIFHGMPHLLGRHYEKVPEQGSDYY